MSAQARHDEGKERDGNCRDRDSPALIWAPVDARTWRAGLQPPLGRPEAEPMDRGGESMQRVAAAR